MQKILLTGATGMVGRNLLEAVACEKYRLCAPSRRDMDLTQPSEVRALLTDFRPDLIIHTAGRVGGIAANIAAPYDFLYENLEMGKNLIAAARELKVPRLLNFSSSCVYPKEGFHPLKEEHILQGPLEPTNEGYALAKLTVMRLGEFAAKTSTLNFKSLIPCNLYGRHDHFDPVKSHLLPAIIMKIHQAKQENLSRIQVWGTGEVRREFMYASDLAALTWQSVELFDQLPITMNIGLGHDFSVNDYYTTAAKVLAWEGTLEHDTSKPEGMTKKLVDDSRMRALGMKAKTSLEAGIRATYEFYLETLKP
jgi:GDP-L-fucose synthase